MKSEHERKAFLCIAAFFAVVAASAAVRDEPGATKKLIALGWDTGDRSVEEVVAHAADFVAAGYDGIAVSMKYPEYRNGKDGKLLGWSSPVYNDEPFTNVEKLLSRVAPMKQLNASGLTHNFVSMTLFFGKWRSYSDDAFWKSACKKAALFAQIARESGSKGVFIDTEDYPHLGQFYYIPKFTDLDFAAEAKFARQRGREFMEALMAEYPDMEILTTWLLSNQSRKSYQDLYSGPLEAAAKNGDLFVPFMQGLVEGLDPRATLIDGNEAGYYCEAARREFCYDYVAMRQLGMGVMPPELRGKYNDQVRAAFGLYIDSYTLPEKSGWAKPAVGGSRLKHYEMNLRQAFETTDKYVWIWGEHHSYATWKDTMFKGNVYSTWEEAMPGVNLMQRFVKDPKGTGEALWKAKVARGEQLVNLVKIDGACVTVSNKQFVGTTAKGFTPNFGRERKDGLEPKWEYVAEGHDGHPGIKQSGTFAASASFSCPVKLHENYGAVYRASVWFKTSQGGKYAIDPTFSFSKVTRDHPIWNDGGGWMATGFKQPGGHAAEVVAGAPDKDGWREAVVYFRADAFDWSVGFKAGLGRRLWEDEWVIISDPQVVMISTTPVVDSTGARQFATVSSDGRTVTLCDNRTEHVIGWLLKGPREMRNAQTVVVQLGGANLRARPPEAETTIDTLRGVRRVIEVLRCHWPQAKIVLRPIALDAQDDASLHARAARVNAELCYSADGVRVRWCDEATRFERPVAKAYEPSVSGWFDYRVSPKRGEIEAKASKHFDAVFMGDSITHLWEERAIDVQKEFLGKYEILNLGFSGDRTQNILWDCENGLLDGYRTDFVSLMIGTNNRKDSVEDVAKGIGEILKAIRAHQPQAKILLFNIFPRGHKADDADRAKVATVNQLIRKLDDGKNVRYVELWNEFLEPDGTISSSVLSDYLHPTAEGYAIWARKLAEEMSK